MSILDLPQFRVFRTLRFRLASITLLLLSVVLVLALIAGTTLLRSVLNTRSELALHDELGALKGYLHFENGKPYWFADMGDAEENAIVARLRELFLLVDDRGHIDENSHVDRTLSALATPRSFMRIWRNFAIPRTSLKPLPAPTKRCTKLSAALLWMISSTAGM